jgi:broad specificity phosphatase PhoE
MPIVILLARHGQTADDIPGKEKVSGWKEVPLNAEGRAEAARLGRFLKSKGITKILASDTKRTTQTAEIVSKIIGVPVTFTPHLRSWNMGSVEGMYAEAAKPFLKFFEKNPDLKIPNGEPFRKFYTRLKTAIKAIIAFAKKFPESRILVLTHSQDLDIVDWIRDGIEPGKAFEFGAGIPAGGCEELRISDEGKITTKKIFGKGHERGG